MLNIRDILVNQAKSIPYNEVGLCLSAGTDSAALLFALLEANKTIKAYSFSLDDRESKDIIAARQLANKYNIEFVPVMLSTNLDNLKQDILILHNKFRCTKKNTL